MNSENRIWILVALYVGVFVGVTCLRMAFGYIGRKLRKWFAFGKGSSSSIRFKPKRFDPRRYYLTTLQPSGGKTPWQKGSRKKDAGKTFLGLSHTDQPVYLNAIDRRTHLQVIGRTGSGKTASVLRNMIYQDILNGHGVIVIDAKGSSTFLSELVGMACVAKRAHDLRILSLAQPWNSFHYNPVRIPPGVSPIQVSDRLFTSIVPNREEAATNYYLKQQSSCLRLMVEALHGTGQPFTIRDLYVWLLDSDVTAEIKNRTKAIESCERIEGMVKTLHRGFSETMSGLIERLQSFSSIDILSAGRADRQLAFDDVLENGRIVFCQLPTGAEPLLARDLARIIFQDIEFETSLREIGIHRNAKKFCAVYADEFYEFTYPDVIGAISKARSGNVGWTLAHQSRSDLTRLGEPYWQGVWDNTAVKVILEQTDPDLGEFVARSLGTIETVKQTWRTTTAVGVEADSGESSNRNAQRFRFDPNNLRNLHPVGQGFVINRSQFSGVNFGLFAPPRGTFVIPRKIGPLGRVSPKDPTKQALVKEEHQHERHPQTAAA